MQSGEERFAELYRRHAKSVYAYCRRRADYDHVDDLVADTFLAAWRKIDQVPDGDLALAWLYGVAYRALLHHWRSSSRRRRLAAKVSWLVPDYEPEPDYLVVQREEARQVLDAASHLKPIDQEILRLVLWEALHHAEVALVLDLSPDAVRQRFSRALKNLTRQYNRLERLPTPAAQTGGAPW
jgi:RNA polymerase sigma-70 factor (ECF subfamily)